MFEVLRFRIRRKLRKLKYWAIKKSCTAEEWKTLRLVRAGYYGQTPQENRLKPIRASIELNDVSHTFMHSAEGQLRYDPQYCMAHKLIRECEEEIAKCVSYVEAWDPRKKMWICTAELNLVEEVKA